MAEHSPPQPVSPRGLLAESPDFGESIVRLKMAWPLGPIPDLSLTSSTVILTNNLVKKRLSGTLIELPATYEFKGVPPGTSSVYVVLDGNQDNPLGAAGDFTGGSSIVIEPAKNQTFPIPVVKIIRLTEPIDTNMIQTSLPIFPGEARFAWEALSPGCTYWVVVSQPGTSNIKTFQTTDASFSLTLAPGDYHLFISVLAESDPQTNTPSPASWGRTPYRRNDRVGQSGWLFQYATPSKRLPMPFHQEGGIRFRVFPSEFDAAPVSGMFLFNGRPITDFTSAPIRCEILDPASGKPASLTMNISGSAWTIPDPIPGTFLIHGTIPGNRIIPEDYVIKHVVSIPIISTGSLQVPCLKVLELEQPEKTSLDSFQSLTPGMFKKVPAQVEFSWKSLGEGVEYRYRTPPFGPSGKTDKTRISLSLKPGLRYSFYLEAFQNGLAIGKLMVGKEKPVDYYFFETRPAVNGAQ